VVGPRPKGYNQVQIIQCFLYVCTWDYNWQACQMDIDLLHHVSKWKDLQFYQGFTSWISSLPQRHFCPWMTAKLLLLGGYVSGGPLLLLFRWCRFLNIYIQKTCWNHQDIALWIWFLFLFIFLIIISFLYEGYIVIFTKDPTIYHRWFHPLHYSPFNRPPIIPGIVSTGLIYPFSYMNI
jgi:hypothetical protein